MSVEDNHANQWETAFTKSAERIYLFGVGILFLVAFVSQTIPDDIQTNTKIFLRGVAIGAAAIGLVVYFLGIMMEKKVRKLKKEALGIKNEALRKEYGPHPQDKPKTLREFHWWNGI